MEFETKSESRYETRINRKATSLNPLHMEMYFILEVFYAMITVKGKGISMI